MLIERFFRVQLNALGMQEMTDEIPKSLLPCKMLIMTSKGNHDETVDFIVNKNNYFGGHASNFEFFPQDMLPALDLNGKILM